jgi:4-amino-4-deoxy-L-arabinose transferase-like glycosyltransferase
MVSDVAGLSPAQTAALERLALPLLCVFALTYRLWAHWEGGPLGGYDERLYLRFAHELQTNGVTALRALVARYPTDPELSQGPLPLRILYVAASALACRLLGGDGYEPLSWLSFASGLGVILFSWALFRRWLGPVPALAGALLVVASPLATALSRRALTDEFFTLWVVATLYFFERSLDDRSRLAPWLLGGCATAAILTKELMLLLYPLLALALVGRSWREARRVLVPLGLAALLAAVVMSWVAGGVAPLVQAYAECGRLNATIDYSVHYQRGPWFRYLVDLLLLSPATLILAAFAIGQGTGTRRAALFALGGLAIFSALPFMNVRFVLFDDVLLRALEAAGIFALAGKLGGRRSTLVAALLLLGALASDIWQYQRIFVQAGVYDPVTAELVHADGLVR